MATVQAPASPAGSVGAAPPRGAAPKAAAETVGSNRELPSEQLPLPCNQEQAGLDALPVPLFPSRQRQVARMRAPPGRRSARLALPYPSVKLVQYGLISLGLIAGDGNKIGFAQARFPRDRLHILCDVIRIYIFIIGSHIFRYNPELHG